MITIRIDHEHTKDKLTRAETVELILEMVGGATEEEAKEIADNCVAARWAGENSSVFHQVAIYYGIECPCHDCQEERARAVPLCH